MRCIATLSLRLLTLSLALTLFACVGMPEEEFVTDPPQSVSELSLLHDSAQQSDLDSAEQSELDALATVWCTDKSWRVDFYAEPELINVVGYLKCQCFRPQTSSGIVTDYFKLAYERTCSLD